ncbi:MAG: ferrous iron transport protein A [Archaeoglobus sp.]|nr:MAG: ferrous iron transport protein A [Archaeoglobus sp.]
MKLSELEPNQKAVIVEIKGDLDIKRKMLSMGISKGTEIRMIRNAPFRDPIEFEVRSYCISLRRDEAESVIVKVKE